MRLNKLKQRTSTYPRKKWGYSNVKVTGAHSDCFNSWLGLVKIVRCENPGLYFLINPNITSFSIARLCCYVQTYYYSFHIPCTFRGWSHENTKRTFLKVFLALFLRTYFQLLLFTFGFLLVKRGRPTMHVVVVLTISMLITFTSGCSQSPSFGEFNAIKSAFNFKSFSITPFIDYFRGTDAKAIFKMVLQKCGNNWIHSVQYSEACVCCFQ